MDKAHSTTRKYSTYFAKTPGLPSNRTPWNTEVKYKFGSCLVYTLDCAGVLTSYDMQLRRRIKYLTIAILYGNHRNQSNTTSK